MVDLALKSGEKVLLVNSKEVDSDVVVSFVSEITKIIGPDGSVKVENSSRLTEGDHPDSTFDVVLSGIIHPQNVVHSIEFLSVLVKAAKPSGRLVIAEAVSTGEGSVRSEKELISNLKIIGIVELSGSEVKLSESQATTLKTLKGAEVKVVKYEGLKPNFEDLEMAQESTSVESRLKMEVEVDDDTKERRLRLLHLYNGVKDTTQQLVGSLAALQRVTCKEIHQRLSLE